MSDEEKDDDPDLRRTCRACGFIGREVEERLESFEKYEHVDAEELTKLRLCDLCACVGSICEGGHGQRSIKDMPISNLIDMLHTVIWKICDGGDPEVA